MAEPRVAFVTGGAGAIGAAVCEALAAQGRRVAVADLDGKGAERVAHRGADRAGAARHECDAGLGHVRESTS